MRTVDDDWSMYFFMIPICATLIAFYLGWAFFEFIGHIDLIEGPEDAWE